MVVFNGMKLLICLVEELIVLFKDLCVIDKCIFVIVNFVKDVCIIVKNIIDLEVVNVVNVGCFDKFDLVIKVKLILSFLLNLEELEVVKELVSLLDLDVFN